MEGRSSTTTVMKCHIVCKDVRQIDCPLYRMREGLLYSLSVMCHITDVGSIETANNSSFSSVTFTDSLLCILSTCIIQALLRSSKRIRVKELEISYNTRTAYARIYSARSRLWSRWIRLEYVKVPPSFWETCCVHHCHVIRRGGGRGKALALEECVRHARYSTN